MPILRIDQQGGEALNRYRIHVAATDIPGLQPLSFSDDIEFALSAQDGERIRWYLEDYLQYTEDPAPAIAEGVEAFMAATGEALFGGVFESSDAGRLWALIEPHLPTTRIEVTTGIAEATAIPWELIRNPQTRTFLALSAQSFVRSQRGGQTTLTPAEEAGKVRILLVICRPRGGEDVPFRSVAGRLVTRLSEDARDAFDLDVLRPPTFEQLAKTLTLAREQGRPYHIVHFDGHGVYAEAQDLAGAGKVLNNLTLKVEGSGPRGFLAFENAGSQANSEFVDGFRLGALLRDSGVPVLVLNACQSAFAEATPKPQEGQAVRDEVEAYGSLAQAVMEAGAAGVVAMRHSVYVVTAAQFVAELYGALARGLHLGEAVAWARRNLSDQPDRRIAYEARPLQDWSVPVVWERAPLRLWPKKTDDVPVRIVLDESSVASPGSLDQALPERPDIGFYGRDETLYGLDRAFDTNKIVLLHAFAGSGKTSTAAEFARWYALTGGVEGPVLFTSFERHLPLARVLDKIGEVFGPSLEAAGVQWDAIVDSVERRQKALEVLSQVPVLWIWDNIEPITGFPAGSVSDWSTEEQEELRDFLGAARNTKAKFLLTSRRDETAWLGALVRRVPVPPMPMQERMQLAGAVVALRGKRLADLPDLRPLLRFTQGNPLTIVVTVGEALRAGIDSPSRLDAFVDALRSGTADFQDEETEGRSKSLGASLSYGFSTAFTEAERKILALLHLFQGFVDVDAMRFMGQPEAEWSLEAVRGLNRERGIAVLDRAAEIGLLTASGGGYYHVHPALPWYFRTLFARHFPEGSGNAARARDAFVQAMGQVGTFYHREYNEGRREVMSALAAEEDNLLAAWRIGRERGLWAPVIEVMQGLNMLYGQTGRSAAWRRMVDEAEPDFVDPKTDEPKLGREEEWGVFTQYRVRIARDDRRLPEAERLQSVGVDRDRKRARPGLAMAPDRRNGNQRNDIRSLVTSLHDLAQIQRQQGNPICVGTYREALELAVATGDTVAQSTCAYNLGNAYQTILELRDLDEAERWFRVSLDLRLEHDRLGRGRCIGQLGSVAQSRFEESRAAKRPVKELASHLADAARYYEQTLQLIPETAITDRGTTHHQLGNTHANAGNIDVAIHHYQQDIRYCEIAGDIFALARHGPTSL